MSAQPTEKRYIQARKYRTVGPKECPNLRLGDLDLSVLSVVAQVLELSHNSPLSLHDLVKLSHVIHSKETSIAAQMKEIAQERNRTKVTTCPVPSFVATVTFVKVPATLQQTSVVCMAEHELYCVKLKQEEDACAHCDGDREFLVSFMSQSYSSRS